MTLACDEDSLSAPAPVSGSVSSIGDTSGSMFPTLEDSLRWIRGPEFPELLVEARDIDARPDSRSDVAELRIRASDCPLGGISSAKTC